MLAEFLASEVRCSLEVGCFFALGEGPFMPVPWLGKPNNLAMLSMGSHPLAG